MIKILARGSVGHLHFGMSSFCHCVVSLEPRADQALSLIESARLLMGRIHSAPARVCPESRIVAKFFQLPVTHVQIQNQTIDLVMDIYLSRLLQKMFLTFSSHFNSAAHGGSHLSIEKSK